MDWLRKSLMRDPGGHRDRFGGILLPPSGCVRLGCLQAKGLVAGIQVVKAGTRKPDIDTALEINYACLRKGLLMFAPVGIAGECLKIAPPLTITPDALRESIPYLKRR